jgi:hypothetical protein
MGTPPATHFHFRLRHLPLAARFLIAAFMCTMGVGFLFGLVQVHFQDAPKGELLPGQEASGNKYNGVPKVSQLERLLTADTSQPFCGSGTMRPAFFEKSSGWANAEKKELKSLREEKKAAAQATGKDEAEAEKEAKAVTPEMARKSLHSKRLAEIEVLRFWIHNGTPEQPYKEDRLSLAADWQHGKPDAKFVDEDGSIKIKSIIDSRCVRCHAEGQGGGAGQAPLEEYYQVAGYATPQRESSNMSLTKLAQTSHVHLLGFGMMYGLTGLIFAFTSYPSLIRCVLAPLPIIVQVAEITVGWWGGRASLELARLTPMFAGVVAGALLLQVVLTLFNMFGWSGRVLVLFFLIAVGLGGWQLKERVIDPYLATEKAAAGQ